MKKQYGWQNFTIRLETNSDRIIDLIQQYTTLKEDPCVREHQIELIMQDRKQGVVSQSAPEGVEIFAQGKIRLEELREYAYYRKGSEVWYWYEA